MPASRESSYDKSLPAMLQEDAVPATAHIATAGTALTGDVQMVTTDSQLSMRHPGNATGDTGWPCSSTGVASASMAGTDWSVLSG
jgi:hypothetical protein